MAALESEQIAGAAIDVFQTEPLPSEHPLWKTKNVIISRIWAASATSMRSGAATIEHNMACFLRGDIDSMTNLSGASASRDTNGETQTGDRQESAGA